MADNHVPMTAWNDTIHKLVEWTTSDSRRHGASFAHLNGAPATGKTTSLPLILWDGITKRQPSTLVVYAGSDLDVGVVVNAQDDKSGMAANSTSRRGLHVDSHTAVGRIVRKHLERESNGQSSPAVDLGLSSRLDDSKLVFPERVVVIVDINIFELTAGLGALLIALFTWALGSESHRRHVRIITMANGDVPPYATTLLRRLSAATGHAENITRFRLPRCHPLLHDDVVVCSVPAQNLHGALERNIPDADKDGHAVVNFSKLDCVKHLFPDDDTTQPLKPSIRPVSDPEDRKSAARDDFARMQRHFSRGDAKYKLFQMSATSHVPGRLKGWDACHLVIPSSALQGILDHEAAYVVEIEAYLSRQVRTYMLSWAARARRPGQRVFVYLITDEHVTADEFLRDGHMTGSFTNFIGKDALGFVSLVASMSTYIKSPLDAARVFVPLRTLEVVLRTLESQEVLRWNNGSPMEGPPVWHQSLPPLALFIDLVDLLRHDVSAALLACQTATSPTSTTLLATVAALISADTWTLTNLGDWPAGPRDTALLKSEVQHAAHAQAGPLLFAGSLWLQTALVQTAILKFELHSWLGPFTDHWWTPKVKVLITDEFDDLSVNPLRCLQALRTMRAIQHVRAKHHQPVKLRPATHKVAVVTETDRSEVLSILLKAYVANMVFTRTDGGCPPKAIDVVANASWELSLRARQAFSWDQERDPSAGGLAFAICVDRVAYDGQRFVQDWTRIPTEIAAPMADKIVSQYKTREDYTVGPAYHPPKYQIP
ncbi:hypothetical protein O9K51_08321 [Purpureocillium lavendulum]|uniref:Uncharacterized protein n=1 Tax=Purpureocillium lavendulum TaxID=1247861 RepID=A0AB34FJP5_9HYPO|nr:hypothetical protein O9K51_08321 [Purpureocillium lavendulum]